MPEVRPFVGLLFNPSVAGPLDDLTAPPYDAITPVDQDRYHRASPYNVIRLILGKENPGDDSANNKYTRAASFLRTWRDQRVLVEAAEPSIYPYETSFQLEGSPRRVRGVIVEVSLEPWGGTIIPHERTLAGPISDRLTLLRAVEANLSPIYTLFSEAFPPLGDFLDDVTREPPRAEVTDEQGTRHRLWATPSGAELVADAVAGQNLWIADGHHRYTVALAYQEIMRARLGAGPWDAMMMLVVDAAIQDPPVLPIHRLRLAGATPRDEYSRGGGQRVRDLAEILASIRDEDVTYGAIHREDGDVVHQVARLDGSPPTVRELHEQLLDAVPPELLRFVPESALAEEAVRAGDAEAAYLLPQTKVERVLGVVEAGERLPQKSTYFWPKPRTGMVIRPFQP